MPDAWDQWLDELSTRDDARIRLLEPGDVEEVLRIIRLHDTDDYRAARRTFEHYAFDATLAANAYVVAVTSETGDETTDERLVGVSGYWADRGEADRIFWVDWTYVNPFFQGRGFGSLLLSAVVETLADIGARKLFVATSSLPKYEAAVGLYQTHGFEREARLEDYYGDGEHQLILGRPMPNRTGD